jgi:uncharacterized alpha/beta hydrolase family protein
LETWKGKFFKKLCNLSERGNKTFSMTGAINCQVVNPIVQFIMEPRTGGMSAERWKKSAALGLVKGNPENA